jgi:hypothetical protein
LKEGKSKDDIIYDKAVQVLHGKKDELHDIFESALKSSDLKGLHAECLTDMWIGRDRFAFIDLSAGPFAWGPAVGGDGVRTELSLPNVAKTIGAVAGHFIFVIRPSLPIQIQLLPSVIQFV